MTSFAGKLLRRKDVKHGTNGDNLARCLTTFDLTFIGIGSTLGMGVYILAGDVALRSAGPAVVLSFFIAAFASVLAGLCYAEFGSRVPRAGSAYAYSYVTVGELMAFIIGWNLILEYVIGTASVAKGYSMYLDMLTNHTLNDTFSSVIEIRVETLAEYPDLFSFGVVILLTGLLAVGVSESTKFNNVFTCLNLTIIIFVLIAGGMNADINNWFISKDSIPEDKRAIAGEGGFFPFGFKGMVAGAATCFYGFIGFDVVATTGEEAKNPRKSIPISIVLSLLCIFLAYFGVSAVLTMMLPYYEQNREAPIPYAFDQVGWSGAKWVITVGALAGLSTSLLGAMFPLPRVIYAMASDGLLFKSLADIHPRFKTPLAATIISGLFAACLSAIFKLDALVDMMSIGTLLAYTLVAVSVLILRYEPGTVNDASVEENIYSSLRGSKSDSSEMILSVGKRGMFVRFFNGDHLVFPTRESSRHSTKTVILLVFVIVGVAAIGTFQLEDIKRLYALPMIALGCLTVVIMILMLSLSRQPKNPTSVSFKVPWVPFIPSLSILINIYLMFNLDYLTWIRFGIWLIIGLTIYFLYGISHSTEGDPKPNIGYLAANLTINESKHTKPHIHSATVSTISDEFDNKQTTHGDVKNVTDIQLNNLITATDGKTMHNQKEIVPTKPVVFYNYGTTTEAGCSEATPYRTSSGRLADQTNTIGDE